jgi:putative glutamine amidotransferase
MELTKPNPLIMKSLKIVIYISFLALIAGCSAPKTDSQPFVIHESPYNILLMNPTVNNLKTFIYLTENDIFPLPEGYKAVGVYHTLAEYNYGQSQEFLEQENISHIALLGLEIQLHPDSLYTQNGLSKIFGYLFENSQGAIFFGGPDIPPALYNEPTHLLTVITDPHRHYLELSLLFHLLGGYQNGAHAPLMEENPEYNILGICLGMQTMNVATGGTMIQDIPMEIYGLQTVEEVFAQPSSRQHRNYQTHFRLDSRIRAGSFHPIIPIGGSLIHELAGGTEAQPNILSSHHQALKKMGKGWKVTATCLDAKVVEAIEHERYPNVIGVQFHPEVPALFSGEPFIQKPGDTTGIVFPEQFPGAQGKDFHLNFWKNIAGRYPVP